MSKFDDLAPQWLRGLQRDLGLTENQAAGILGNLGFESGGFEVLQEERPLVEGSRGGYGVAQWTGPRRVAFESWCLTQKLAPSSDEANYGYLLVELRSTMAEALRRLRLTTSLGAAVFSFGRYFEAPAGTTDTHLPGYDDRLAYAKRALTGLQIAAPNGNSLPQIADIVRQLQTALAASGYDPGPADGIMGPRTYAAILAAQG